MVTRPCVPALSMLSAGADEKKISALSCALMCGDEAVLKREVEQCLRRIVVPPPHDVMNFQTCYAATTPAAEIVDIARTPPFGGARRMLVVRQAECLEERSDLILAYARAPATFSLLLLDTDKNQRHKVVKMLAPIPLIDCSPLKERQLYGWIQAYAAEKQYPPFSEQVIAALIDALGDDLQALKSAVDTLFEFTAGKKAVTVADVTLLVKRGKTTNSFVFLDALLQRHTARAVSLAREALQNGQDIAELIGLLFWQFKRLDSVQRLAAAGHSAAEIVRLLEMHPYAANQLLRAAKSVCPRTLARNISIVRDADLTIKHGGRLAPVLLMDILIIKLCAGAAG